MSNLNPTMAAIFKYPRTRKFIYFLKFITYFYVWQCIKLLLLLLFCHIQLHVAIVPILSSLFFSPKYEGEYCLLISSLSLSLSLSYMRKAKHPRESSSFPKLLWSFSRSKTHWHIVRIRRRITR